MSRIGKQPIVAPEKVKVTVAGDKVNVEGPLGKLSHTLPEGITCAWDGARRTLSVQRASDIKRIRQLHGLTRTLINNMVLGVTQGYKRELEVVGIGYSVKKEGNALAFQLGFANTVKFDLPPGIQAEVTQPTNPGKFVVSGCDKHLVGQFAAHVRSVREPEPYQGKGIRYVGEQVRRKAGKALVGSGG